MYTQNTGSIIENKYLREKKINLTIYIGPIESMCINLLEKLLHC
jgi:hypothetical protein